MATLGKEATTLRRVMESLFRYFDNGNMWPIKDGIALPVLKDVQFLMEDSGLILSLVSFDKLLIHTGDETCYR